MEEWYVIYTFIIITIDCHKQLVLYPNTKRDFLHIFAFIYSIAFCIMSILFCISSSIFSYLKFVSWRASSLRLVAMSFTFVCWFMIFRGSDSSGLLSEIYVTILAASASIVASDARSFLSSYPCSVEAVIADDIITDLPSSRTCSGSKVSSVSSMKRAV